MPLMHKDFELSEQQLKAINEHVSASAKASTGEPIEMPEVSVTFTFVAGLGRFVDCKFNSSTTIKEIEGSYDIASTKRKRVVS